LETSESLAAPHSRHPENRPWRSFGVSHGDCRDPTFGARVTLEFTRYLRFGPDVDMQVIECVF
jgi:hypothetical protein